MRMGVPANIEERKAKTCSNSMSGKEKNIERPDEPLDLIDENEMSADAKKKRMT